MSLEQPLSLCCESIVEIWQKLDSSHEKKVEETNEDSFQPPEKKTKKDKSVKDNGGTEASDQPINDTLVHCEIAKQLISFRVDIRIRNSSGITSISDKFRGALNKVARRQEYEIVEQILYHRAPIGSGSFGDVFMESMKKMAEK